MRYVEARIDEYNREEAYRNYISTSLQLIPQNKWIASSFYDLMHQEHKEKEQSGEEILVSLMARAGLRFEE